MKNFRNFLLAVSVMVGISAIESSGIYFWIALAMVIIPFAVLGIEAWKKQAKVRKYEKVKANCENVDFLSDCVIFGESVMLK
jgi:heme exporter protein D